MPKKNSCGITMSAMTPDSYPRFCAFLALSIDGFLAGPGGELDWLDRQNAKVPAGQDCGFADFMAGVDLLVMGRATFDKVLSFGFWPYGHTPVHVLTHRELELPDYARGKVSFSAEAPMELARRLGMDGLQKIYVDGGQVLRSFVRAGLLAEMTLTQVPVVLGGGISLFADLGLSVDLELIESKSWPFGYVQNRYRLNHSSN